MKRASLIVIATLFAATFFLAGCRERTIYTGGADWLLLATDADDGGVAYNADSFYVDADFTDAILVFKMVTYAAIPNVQDSILMAVYFDTDRSVATGLSVANTSYDVGAKPTTIGADYMMFVGSEITDAGKIYTNRIFSWNSTDNIWDTLAVTATNLYQPAGASDSVIGGVDIATLGNPTAVDVEAIFYCALANTGAEYRDHVPNTGHATIDLAADSVIQASPSLLLAGPAEESREKRHVSLITGKAVDLVEVK